MCTKFGWSKACSGSIPDLVFVAMRLALNAVIQVMGGGASNVGRVSHWMLLLFCCRARNSMALLMDKQSLQAHKAAVRGQKAEVPRLHQGLPIRLRQLQLN